MFQFLEMDFGDEIVEAVAVFVDVKDDAINTRNLE